MIEAERNGNLLDISLAALLHERGLNCRHIGLVRRHISPKYRSLLAVEMTARAVRTDFYRDCRVLHGQLASPLSDPFVRLLLTRLNILLTNRPEADECGDALFLISL